MSTRDNIITLPHADLRRSSTRIHVITAETIELINDMKQAALDWEDSRPHEIAVALAAVQIDRLERIIIVRNDFENKEDRSFTVLINPEIAKQEGDIIYDHEGCLSVRDIYGLVPRHSKVRVRAMDEQGRDVRLKAEGFVARILQHEIDHTNGIMFVDHIKDQAEAFYHLSDNGELEHLDYADVETSDIFRD